MPLACVIRGKTEGEESTSPNCLHAALLSLFREVDPNLSKTLHEKASQKPFTLSPLFRQKDTFWFRVTFLDDSLSNPFFSFFLEKPGIKLNLGQQQFKVKELKISRNPWCAYTDYRSLFKSRDFSKEITLEFRTPTCFRQGNLDLPLPLPRLVFQSFYNKWMKFAQNYQLLTNLIDIIIEEVGISKMKIKTVPFDDGHVVIPGFVGKVTFLVSDKVDNRTLQQINLLANYAFFSGTGRKTTYGMGMTRRII